jgi:hypothetical protein
MNWEEAPLPYLERYAQSITVLGEDPGSAASLKLVANFFGGRSAGADR